MKYEWLDEHLLSLPGAEKDYKAEWEWHRYLVRGKMFAAICSPDPTQHRRYGHELINLKCEPRLAELFRAEYPEVLPGFYMDKANWNAVRLDGDLPDDVLRGMCDMSHQLVVEKLPKKVQRELKVE